MLFSSDKRLYKFIQISVNLAFGERRYVQGAKAFLLRTIGQWVSPVKEAKIITRGNMLIPARNYHIGVRPTINPASLEHPYLFAQLIIAVKEEDDLLTVLEAFDCRPV
ncbi:hypothetical protein MBAV_001917 [Candidatus Magnetobacterium bavaricum]|uniref:Uncharacterized protein n=1 Tax=Candidatus Magnetobacterium bavaricum TaxID=29290 RepID=A0A0F3GYY1_9BACT|nr:hypothetical protein MBAV_001917 [Candidatus Magnetobacterium bavaricum]